MITPVALTPELLLAKLKANPHPKQTLLEMAGGFAYITINGQKIAYNGEKWFACGQQITPQFSMNNLHQEIDRVFVLAQKMKDDILKTDTKEQTIMTTVSTEQTFVSTDRYRELEAELKTMTASRDEAQKKNDFINGQMSDLLAEREGLFAKIKTVTEERDRSEVNYSHAQRTLSQVWDAIGWMGTQTEPCSISYAKRLKSKADRAGLLSVVCRRLCDDENASSETVHKALDSVDVCITNLAASHEQVDKYRVAFKQVEKIRLELMSALDDYNSPTHYGNHPEGNRLGTVERVRIGLLVLWSKWNEAQQKVNQLEGKVDQLTMLDLYFAHKTLDTLNAPRLAGGHELDLSARIRSLFNTKV